MLCLLLLGIGMVSSTQAILIGENCTTHTYCNYDGSSPLDHTSCDSSTNTCQCTSLYYGVQGDSECTQASLGDACTVDEYCHTACGRAICSSGTCVCSPGKYKDVGTTGTYVCFATTIGTLCDSANNGTLFCQYGITNAICSSAKQSCGCSDGETYEPFSQLCQPANYGTECDVCRATGGSCYDLENDNTATGCACPSSKNSSGADAAGSLVNGCDVGLADIGDTCDKTGYPIKCISDHSECVHAGNLNSQYKCACDAGYFPVVSKYDSGVSNCYGSLSAHTDPNCYWCVERGGVCYDIDYDKIRDGCNCPVSRSTPVNSHSPRDDCSIAQLSVDCKTTTMTICYKPHNTTTYPNIKYKLDNDEAFVYIKNHRGKDPCIFEKDSDSGDWCLTLDIGYNETDACETVVSYPEANVVNYQNWLVLQMGDNGRSNDDLFFQLYCSYDTLVHTVTGKGAEAVGFAFVASEGEEIHPKMVMSVTDQFGQDISKQGVHLGDPIAIEVEMTDDAGVYRSLRPEVCIASSRPELSSPSAVSMLLLFDGCPFRDSVFNLRNLFYRDPTNMKISRTGLFPSFKFEDSDFVFFHCAVKVCRIASDCVAANCTGVSFRRKRAVRDSSNATANTHDGPAVARSRRQAGYALENLQSAPIRILSGSVSNEVFYQEEEHDLTVHQKKRPKRRPKTPMLPILIASSGCFLCLIIIISAALVYRFRFKKTPMKHSSGGGL